MRKGKAKCKVTSYLIVITAGRRIEPEATAKRLENALTMPYK